MAVQERLSLDAVSSDTLLAVEHIHRYAFAARLCRGLRVIDLACGSGYGSTLLRESAPAVLGVDNDAATVDMARTTVGSEHDIEFETADAADFLRRDLSGWDAIVCFEGLEHFEDPRDVIKALARHAEAGTRLILSVPNSRTFGEENEFHVTHFGYDEAMEAFRGFKDLSVIYQFNAEGSLIRGEHPAEADGEFVLPEHGEPEYANHFIACMNLDEELRASPESARARLAIAPAYNRHMLNLERSNTELWRENARLARKRIGKADAAAAAQVSKSVAEQRERAERAEARVVELEAEVERLRYFETMFGTPRHQALEQTRDKLMQSSLGYGVVRRLWARFNQK